MASPMIEYDHAVIRVDDLILAERFYGEVFGAIFGDAVTVEHTSTCTVEEVIELGRRGGPGTRRAAIEQERFGATRSEADEAAARIPGMPQGTVHIGEALIPLFLARKHYQEPPPEQLRGSPRHAFPATPEQFEKGLEVLRQHKVPFEGPVEYAAPCPVAKAIYFKDTASNFLELCVPREI